MKGAEIRARHRAWYAKKGAERQREFRQRRQREDFFAHRAALPSYRAMGVTAAQLRSLWEAQQGRCALTGRELAYEDAHLDHRVPRALGGSDDPALDDGEREPREARVGGR